MRSNQTRILIILMIGLAIGTSAIVLAAPPKKGPTCEAILKHGDSIMGEYTALLQRHPFSAIFENLAAEHPYMVMNSYQRAWAAIRTKPPREILDPTYRSSKVTYWPALEDGTAELGGKMMVGHYRTLNTVVNLIKAGARGDRAARKIIRAVGPAGTGKTELAVVLTKLMDVLGLSDSRFLPMTYEFFDLQKIPQLNSLFGEEGVPEIVIPAPMSNSPLVLLPEALQNEVVTQGRGAVQELTGFDPLPFRMRDPVSGELLRLIIKHYAEGKTTFTVKDYLEVLEKHVRIVPKVVDPNRPPPIIGFMGKNIRLQELFFAQSPLFHILGASNPLSYMYDGSVLQANGGVFVKDEFSREDATLGQLFYDLAENRVVRRGGAPPVHLDALAMAADNFESMDELAQNAKVDAGNSRMLDLPMPGSLHPHEVGRILLAMDGVGMYRMRDLNATDPTESLPADINSIFPPPGEDGILRGPDGHYVLTIPVGEGKEVVMAPHALDFIDLVVAATRMVTDPGKLEPHKRELKKIGTAEEIFTNPITRLKAILGQIQVEPPVRRDLDKIRDLLQEGRLGINQRYAQSWLLKAREIAEESAEGELTPSVINKAFLDFLGQGTIRPSSGDSKTNWLNMLELVKRHFILPMLMRDIQAIVVGESDRVDLIYNEVRQEITALNNVATASKYTPRGGSEEVRINFERLRDIETIYKRLNGRQLERGEVVGYHIDHEGESDVAFEPLKAAIERYLMKRTLNTEALTEIKRYFEGEAVSRDASRRATIAEQNMAKFGYTRRAFREALHFVWQMAQESDLVTQ